MALAELTQEQQAEQARIAEIYKAHAMRTNTIDSFAGAFPRYRKGAEHVHLLAAAKSAHAACTRYEEQREESCDLYPMLAEVFVQIAERLATLAENTE